MRIFKHRIFHQWTESEGLTDATLKEAINEIERGLYEVNLGSGLYKKRIHSQGKGKSSGYRTLVAFKKETLAFFVYGFAKNVRTNINQKEEKIYRQLAKEFLSMDDATIKQMIECNKLYEVK